MKMKTKIESPKIRIALTGIIITLSTLLTFAQQDAQFSQYMFNTMAVNPGYAGSKQVMTAMVLSRSQWLGIEGAPQTQTVTFHTPVISKNIGLGFSLVNDKIGPMNETSLYIDFA